LRGLQVPEEVRLRVDHQRGVLAERGVALERARERIERRVLTVRLAVDLRGLGVGAAADLLALPLSPRLDSPELPLHVAQDLLAAAFAFGAEPRGDALALGDHPALH